MRLTHRTGEATVSSHVHTRQIGSSKLGDQMLSPPYHTTTATDDASARASGDAHLGAPKRKSGWLEFTGPEGSDLVIGSNVTNVLE